MWLLFIRRTLQDSMDMDELPHDTQNNYAKQQQQQQQQQQHPIVNIFINCCIVSSQNNLQSFDFLVCKRASIVNQCNRLLLDFIAL
jgi:hypothetical protein